MIGSEHKYPLYLLECVGGGGGGGAGKITNLYCKNGVHDLHVVVDSGDVEDRVPVLSREADRLGVRLNDQLSGTANTKQLCSINCESSAYQDHLLSDHYTLLI